ncbi:MAG TPA: type II toxin-antitoxin system prevent-host-death family antitoxin [Lacisediminihabitans sp.]|uniref:type II toxin-antitoxin system Phd/YefM family antitoxin n=1 Tax=Lacisediminihabitans sp. TaxID=2787631 RepID=UPI002ED96EF5
MMINNVHEAKSQLSKLLDAVERGEEVYVTRRGSGVNRFQIVAAPIRRWSELHGVLRNEIPADTDFEAADRAVAEILIESLETPDR